MYDLDSWKNKKVFDSQLDLNLKELKEESTYPAHWLDNIKFISEYSPRSILDVGCGCGSFIEVCKRKFPEMEYFGIDYATEAIELATSTWGNSFEVLDYKNLTKEKVQKYDLIYLSALLDVLPDANEAFKFMLSLDAPQLLVSRVKLSNEPNMYQQYRVYDAITTYAYQHNRIEFFNTIKSYGYSVEGRNDNFYLSK